MIIGPVHSVVQPVSGVQVSAVEYAKPGTLAKTQKQRPCVSYKLASPCLVVLYKTHPEQVQGHWTSISKT
jgi:hypothetical protein